MKVVKKFNAKNKKGFTLIEGIMVVAIIAILALILIPNVTGVINKNKVNAYNNMIDSVTKATSMYVSDNRYSLSDIDCSGSKELSIKCVPVQDLIEAGDLSEKFVNPITKEKIDYTNPNEQVLVTYYCRSKKFDYTYREKIKKITDEQKEFNKDNCVMNINIILPDDRENYNTLGKNGWFTSDVLAIIKPNEAIKKYNYCIKKDDCVKQDATGNKEVTITEESKELRVCAYSDLTGEVCSDKIMIDKTKPNAPKMQASDNIASGEFHNAKFSIKLTGSSAISGITYYYGYDKNDINTIGEKIEITSVEENQPIYAKACSGAGLCSDISTYIVNLDDSVPETPIITASDGIKSNYWHGSTFSLKFSQSDVSKNVVYYSGFSEDSMTTEGDSHNVILAESGKTLYVKACSKSGNCSSISNYVIKIDNSTSEHIQPPTITASDGVSSYGTHTSGFTLTFSGSSSPSGVTYYYSTSTIYQKEGSKVEVATKDDGVNFTVKACNKVGICSSESSYHVTISVKPDKPIIVPSDGIESGKWHTEYFRLTLKCGASGCYRIKYGLSKTNLDLATNGTEINIIVQDKRTYYAQACNEHNECSDFVSYDSMFDKTDPLTPSITASDSITSNNWHTAAFSLNFKTNTSSAVSGLTFYSCSASYCSTDSLTGYASGSTLSIPITYNGKTIHVKVCTGAGKCSSNYYIVRITSVPPAPTLTISDNIKSGNWHKSQFTITPKINSESGFTIKYMLATNNTSSSQFSVAYNKVVQYNTTSAGTTYYYKACKSQDSFEVCGPTVSYLAKLDKTTPSAPTVKASDNIASGSKHKSSFTLKFSGSTAVSGISYYYGTSSCSYAKTKATSISITSSKKGTTYYIKACGASGLCSSCTQYKVVY